MKAILVTAAGGTDVLQLKEVPKPELPSPHHIRVKLAAAGVNPVDTKLRAKPAYHPDKLPAILGCDGAGIIEETGSAVTRFKAGDAVYFCNGGLGDEPGCYAEFTTLHEDYCAAAPANLSLQEAAALPLVLITAWEALIERAQLQAGQTVLIHAAAGGVGHVALQLAYHLGARIAVTVSDDKKAGLAHGLGAEKIIRYRTQDFVRETLDWTNGQARPPLLNPLPQTVEEATKSLREFRNNGQGADVVFDTAGGDTFLRSLDAARVGGRVVSILATAMTQADAQKARLRNLTLGFELMLTPQVMYLHDERVRQRRILEQGAVLVEQGKLGVLVSHRLPLAQAADAHRMIEAGGMIGKIVLTME